MFEPVFRVNWSGSELPSLGGAGAVLLPQDSAAEITNRGNEAHLRMQWETAIDLYNQALSVDNKYYIAHFNLGLTHQNWSQRINTPASRNAQLDIGSNSFDSALNLRPNEAVVFAHLGIVAHYLHEYQKAIEFFDRAIQGTTDPLIKAEYHYNRVQPH